MRSLALVAAAVLTSGCAFGGGPYAGYSFKRGVVVGAEASGGLGPLQVAMGAQNVDLFRYIRFDFYGNKAPYRAREGSGGGLRVGAGYGSGTNHPGGGVFAIGPNAGYAFVSNGCERGSHSVVFGLELRYAAGEGQIVAMSRYDRLYNSCIGN